MNRDDQPKRMATRLSEQQRSQPGRQPEPTDPRRRPLDRSASTIGAGAGAVFGGATGAVIGAAGGPLGSVIGAGIGAIAGGVAGREVGQAVNPTEEQDYWQSEFPRRSYARGRGFETYEPAYRYGWESAIRYGGRTFDDVEDELGREWDSHRGRSDLGWLEARPAARDAWNRVHSRIHERGRTADRIIT